VSGWPVWASHTRAVLSQEAVTTRRPSGLNWADLTLCSCRSGSVMGRQKLRKVSAERSRSAATRFDRSWFRTLARRATARAESSAAKKSSARRICIWVRASSARFRWACASAFAWVSASAFSWASVFACIALVRSRLAQKARRMLTTVARHSSRTNAAATLPVAQA